jgi:hypothetical protein
MMMWINLIDHYQEPLIWILVRWEYHPEYQPRMNKPWLLIRGYLPNSHNLILTVNGTPPIKHPFYSSRVDINGWVFMVFYGRDLGWFKMMHLQVW